MLMHHLDQQSGVLRLEPSGKIEAGDFKAIAEEVDTFIEQQGHLAGVIIRAERFPGWQDLSALIEHLQFVRNHQQKVDRVAIVTDDKVLSHMPDFAKHFVSAKIEHFSMAQEDEATNWVAAATCKS